MKLIKLYLTFLVSLFVFSANASSAPDNEQILKEISTKGSPYYYPELFLRYKLGDQTLNEKDYYYLYYGYAHQAQYRPLENNTAADNLMVTIEQKNISEENRIELMLKFALESFEYDPFSLMNINFLTYIYGVLDDTKNEAINAERLRMIIKTIQSSGSGTSEDTPWHVLYFAHSSDLLTTMGEKTAKRIIISRSTEFFPLINKTKALKGYYFDYSRVYSKKPEAESKIKRSTGFEINGFKTR